MRRSAAALTLLLASAVASSGRAAASSPAPAAASSPAPAAASSRAQAAAPAASRPTQATAPTVGWRDEWPRFSRFEYAYTTALLLGVVGLAAVGGRQDPGWRGGVLFDEAARDAFVLGSSEARLTAQSVSDAFYRASFVYPIVDATVFAWLVHGSGDVAAQMLLIDIEAIATTGFLSFFTNATIGRERPYVRDCPRTEAPGEYPSCKASGPNLSFFSGHTGIAVTAAALTCAHHAQMPLYGYKALDVSMCIAAMGAAATTGVTRIMADKHYATDVVTGAVIGLASGFGFAALHYRSGAPAAAPRERRAGAIRMIPAPMVSPTSAGLSVVGLF